MGWASGEEGGKGREAWTLPQMKKKTEKFGEVVPQTLSERAPF